MSIGGGICSCKVIIGFCVSSGVSVGGSFDGSLTSSLGGSGGGVSSSLGLLSGLLGCGDLVKLLFLESSIGGIGSSLLSSGLIGSGLNCQDSKMLLLIGSRISSGLLISCKLGSGSFIFLGFMDGEACFIHNDFAASASWIVVDLISVVIVCP